MAWIESHQGLRDHPKTRRVARTLDVSIPTVVGHLHCLWHTVVDAAPDGDLSDWTADDVAFAAMWEGDPKHFVDALVECGMGSGSGFLDRNADSLTVHDWDDYAAPLQARKRASAKAHHVRWHESEGLTKRGCEFCEPDAPDVPDEREPDADGMRDACDGNADAMRTHTEHPGEPDEPDQNADAMRTHANRNAPDLDLDLTGPDQTLPPTAADNGSAVTAQHLLAEHIDACNTRPPDRVVGHLAREIDNLLNDDGIEPDAIRAGLDTVRRKSLHPSTLPSAVNEAMNPPEPKRARSTDLASRYEAAAQHLEEQGR